MFKKQVLWYNKEIKKDFKEFFNTILYLFKDISFLYKNFFHWNISKLIIKIYSFFLWISFSFPFIVFLIIIAFIDPINWLDIISGLASDKTMWIKIIWTLLVHPFFVTFEIFIFVLFFISFIFWYSYSIFLETNLYNEYINKNKLGYLKNYYFNLSIIKQYTLILLRILWYLFLYFSILICWFILFYILINNISNTFFYTLVLKIKDIFLFSFFILFFYILYRIIFSYIIYIDSKKDKKASFYIKKSIKLTKPKKVLFKFVGGLFLLFLLILPFAFIKTNIDTNVKNIKLYLWYKYWVSKLIDENDLYKYNILKATYENTSDKDLKNELRRNYYYSILYTIFSFLVLDGLFTMFIVSFYRRNYKKKWLLSKLWIWN